MTYKVQESVFLDNFNKCYLKILTINKKPDKSPLKENVKELPRQRLSPFDYDCNCQIKPHCFFAIINPDTKQFIQSDQIEVAVDLLVDSGYTINYQLTKLVKKNNERLLFYFS